MPEFEFVATTLSGLEDLLEEEIRELGGSNIKKSRRAIRFSGSFALMYKVNYSLRTAMRILWKLKSFRIKTDEDFYRGIYKIPWENYFAPSVTLAVQSVVNSPVFSNSHYAALRAKDAIVDRVRDKTGRRPDVRLKEPDLLVNIHVSQSFVDVSLDSSGDPLFKRGYREDGFKAPLNEVLAAGMIKLSGWTGESDFYDPMCGSGTLAIEAAMIALGIPPGVFRKNYGFQKWPDYDEVLFRKIADREMKGREFVNTIYASDISASAVVAASANLKKAMLDDIIQPGVKDFFHSEPENQGVMIMNPPYGERIKQYRITDFYKKIGDHLKFSYSGWSAWILSANMDALKMIGLKPSCKIPLMNGSLECRFNKYELFKGKRNDHISHKK